MKKFSYVLLSSMFILTACSQGDMGRKTEELINNNLESEKILKHEISSKNIELENFLLDSLGIANESVTIEDSESYLKFKENVRDLKSKTKVVVDGIKFNESKNEAVATVDIEFMDAGSSFAEAIEESLERSIVSIYAGKIVTESNFYDSTLNLLLETKEIKTTKLENISVELNKIGEEWKIKNLNEDLIKALTLNFSESQNKLFNGKVEKVKESRIFIEIESNLRKVHSEVSEFLNQNKLSADKVSNAKEISEKLSEELGENVSFDKEIQGYNVSFDSEKNEIYVEYINGEDKFKFSEKLN